MRQGTLATVKVATVKDKQSWMFVKGGKTDFMQAAAVGDRPQLKQKLGDLLKCWGAKEKLLKDLGGG